MKKIEVIDNVAQKRDITQLSQDERTIAIDKLSTITPNIHQRHFLIFDKSQTDIINTDLKYTIPTANDLLLRKIISEFDDIKAVDILPIIIYPGISYINTERQHKYKQSTVEKTQLPQNAINIKFDKNIKCLAIKRKLYEELFGKRKQAAKGAGIKGGNKNSNLSYFIADSKKYQDIVIPQGNILSIIGLQININCPRKYIINTELQPILDVPDEDILHIGNYTPEVLAEACNTYTTKYNYANADFDDIIMFDNAKIKNNDKIFHKLYTFLTQLLDYKYTGPNSTIVYEIINNGIPFKNKFKTLTKFEPIEQDQILIERQNSVGSVDIVKILKYLESFAGIGFSNVFPANVYTDIYNINVAPIFNSCILYGKDSDKVQNKVAIYETAQQIIRLRRKIANNTIQQENLKNIYLIIIKNKFGIKRHDEVKRLIELKPIITEDIILGQLTQQERKIVSNEYNRRQNYLASVANNKCPHVKLSKLFRNAISESRQKQYYTQLQKFFPNKIDNKEMIKCNNCGFDIICPHIKTKTDITFSKKIINNLSDSRSKYNLIRSAMNKFIDNIPLQNYYYCKICGEAIVAIDAFESATTNAEQYSSIKDDIKTAMWSEYQFMTKSVRLVKIIDIYKLINEIINVCYPFIYEINKLLLKSKTSTEKDIKNKLRLFISIYGYAYLAHYIISTKGQFIVFDRMKDSQKTISEYLTFIVREIINSKNIIIREIPSITNDFIKNKTIEAYKAIMSLGKIQVETLSEREEIWMILYLDPVYEYIYNIYLLDKFMLGQKPKQDKMTHLNTLMGMSVDALGKLAASKDIFGKTYTPDKLLKMKHKMQLSNITPPQNDYKKFKPSYTDYLLEYRIESYKLFVKYLHERLYLEHAFVKDETELNDNQATNKSFDEENTAIASTVIREGFTVVDDTYSTKKLNEYYALFDKLAKYEQIMWEYKKFETIKAYNSYSTKGSDRYEHIDVSLERIYNNKGTKNKWNIFIFSDGKNKKELTIADIKKILGNLKPGEENPLRNYKIVDKKSSNTELYFSNVNKTGNNLNKDNNNKIKEVIATITELENFFAFYYSRCPVSSTHEYTTASSHCKKCGYSSEFSKNVQSKDSSQYFAKYKNKYLEDKEELMISKSDFDEPETYSKIYDKINKDIKPELEKFVYDFNYAADLSKILKLKPQQLNLLGASEYQEYSDIETGKYNPKDENTPMAHRIYILSNYIQQLFIEYNRLRYYSITAKPSYGLKKILLDSGYPKHEYNKLSSLLPDIYDNFNEKMRLMQTEMKAKKLVEWLIENFSKKCMQILNHKDKKTEMLRKLFVKEFVNSIIKQDKLVSRYDKMKLDFGVFGMKTDKISLNKSEDANFTVMEELDPTEEELEDNDFGSTDAPFSTEDLDMEYDLDEDNNDNDIGVEFPVD